VSVDVGNSDSFACSPMATIRGVGIGSGTREEESFDAAASVGLDVASSRAGEGTLVFVSSDESFGGKATGMSVEVSPSESVVAESTRGIGS